MDDSLLMPCLDLVISHQFNYQQAIELFSNEYILTNNKVMNKKELIKRLSTKSDLNYQTSKQVIDVLTDILSEELAQGHSVRIINFGCLIPHKTSERWAKNPQNGNLHLIKSRIYVKFKTGKLLFNKINPK